MQFKRIKKQLRAAACLLLCVGILLPCIALSDDTRAVRESTIYETLVEGLKDRGAKNPEAVACGILGNIKAEVGGSPYNYDPTTVGDYSGGVATSGGICGWHNAGSLQNFTHLRDWCKENGYPWFEVEDNSTVYKDGEAVAVTEKLRLEMLRAQAQYILYDLYESGSFDDTCPRILAAANDIHGAWYVGYIFCSWYERPQDYWNKGYTRGGYAQSFWTQYVDSAAERVTTGDEAESTLTIQPTTLPKNRKSFYDSFVIRGTVASNYPICSVDVYVTDAYGERRISFSRTAWDSCLFDIKWDGADSSLAFGKLSTAGSYVYCIDATDVSGKTAHFSHIFYLKEATTCLYSFDCAGGTAISNGTANFGSTITLPTPENYPGYLFDGWSDGTSTYNAGDSYTVLKTDVTFTAKWKACPHNWDEGQIVPPAIGQAGYTLYTCKDCGQQEQRDAVAALVPGDVNGDGVLTAADLHLLGRHIAGIEALSDTTSADVNGDGILSAADLTALSALVNETGARETPIERD